MRIVKTFLLLTLVYTLQGCATAPFKPYTADPQIIKDNVRKIGILVSGMSANPNADTYRCDFRLEKYKGGSLWGVMSGGLANKVLDDGSVQANVLSDSLISTYGFVSYDGLNMIMNNIFANSLGRRGYETVYLNNQDFMKGYDDNKTICQIIDTVKSNMPDIDAVLFVFYCGYNGCSENLGYAIRYQTGYFIYLSYLMHSTADNKDLLCANMVDGKSSDLSYKQMALGEEISSSGPVFKFSPIDVLSLLAGKINTSISEALPLQEKRKQE